MRSKKEETLVARTKKTITSPSKYIEHEHFSSTNIPANLFKSHSSSHSNIKLKLYLVNIPAPLQICKQMYM